MFLESDEGRRDLELPTSSPCCTHAVAGLCEEVSVLTNPSRRRTVWEGGGPGGLPVPLWERKPKSCLWKPGILLAGIPGPAQGLSHGIGQSGERTGDPELVQSKKMKGWPFLETRMGVLSQGMRVSVRWGTHGGGPGHTSPFGAGSGELETLGFEGPGSGQLRGGSSGFPRPPLPPTSPFL